MPGAVATACLVVAGVVLEELQERVRAEALAAVEGPLRGRPVPQIGPLRLHPPVSDTNILMLSRFESPVWST